jgi:energy-coupling factor transporter ATP-binding protein EcfA2
MSELSDLSVGSSPYPGLRPFRSDEADIFFGREEYVDHLLEKLGQNRFLAVMGPSGCGKSSLLQAGVIPALQTGFLADAGAEWRIATMRPGNHPMERLAESLLAETALGPERAGTPAAAAVLQATLLRGPLGLVEVLRETPLPEAASLLLLVDQFEEIFRFRQQGYNSEAEADTFVELLLATIAQRAVPVYVVLTMRSDFLGDCALFHDLPEAINNSQFLTPRLTRTQQQVAIEGPASVFGGTIEAALVNRLLNDMGLDPDQLPLMQHILMRMWTRKVAAIAEGREKDTQEAGLTLTLADYAAIGGLSEALSWHADEAFAELDERHQRVAEVLFRCLSERSLERRDTRRPVPVSTVAAVAGVSWQQVAEVVEVFRRPDRSFLTPPSGMALHPETILDISHESLIRQWRRMTEWVDKEARSAEAYRRLEQTARLWHAEPEAQRRKDYLWHGA